MRVLVIGLGSMGKRRIRLMKQYDSGLEIIGIDSNIERRETASDQFLIKTYETIEAAENNGQIECAFVCTSPLSHFTIIRQLVRKGIHVFTEINLVSDGYSELIDVSDVKLFLSSTFLYRKDIGWIMNRIRGQKVNYLYHTGQYLPDWHPWENYKNFFVGDRRTNGCREILAIELPWIIECFGKIEKLSVIKDKMSDLKIDYPDNYLLQIEHENGNKGQIAVDVIARKAVRRIEIFNQKLQLFWNGSPDSLQEWEFETGTMKNIVTYGDIQKDKNYCDNIIENAYMDEIDAFFSWINGDHSKIRYGFEKDLETLKVIDKIEGKTFI
ncbi:MAG: Gfo/Idh/MocA family oxidoreductase [Anaeroplasmataceae bacterium]|nr:Gfo/Idh/MocA family oxidoreductase [Anaeroplasmataceae bacterium]